MTKGDKSMSNEDWIINLENTADEVAGICGREVVLFILREHGARSIYDLNPGDYEGVFSELYAYIENDN
jgi:hypothetical protein